MNKTVNTIIALFTNLEPDTEYTIKITANKNTKSVNKTIIIKTDTKDDEEEEQEGEEEGEESIKPEGLLSLFSDHNNIDIVWTDIEGVEYSGTAVPSTGGDIINGITNDIVEGIPAISFNNLTPDTTYKITITGKKGDKEENSDPIEVKTLPEPVISSVSKNTTESVKPIFNIENLETNDGFTVTVNKMSGATYTVSAVKVSNNGETPVNATNMTQNNSNTTKLVAKFTGLLPGKYKISVVSKTEVNGVEESNTKNITIGKNNNASSIIAPVEPGTAPINKKPTINIPNNNASSIIAPVEPGTAPVEPGTAPVEPGTAPVEPGTAPINKKPTINIPNNNASSIIAPVEPAMANNGPTANNLAKRKKLAENAAAVAIAKKPKEENSEEVLQSPVNNKPTNKNKTNKKYSAQNVKIFSGQLSKLQQDLQELQRGKRTPQRAAKIQSILSNIQVLKGETGKNSKTIKNKLTSIQQKYANVNKKGRLTVGGKRNTFKKVAPKKKHTTMKKQRK